MRIKELKLHPIAVADGPLRSSYGLHAPYALRTIVEVVTTDGITGISETYGGDGPVGALESVRHRVEGMDPFQLTGFWQYLQGQAREIEAQATDRQARQMNRALQQSDDVEGTIDLLGRDHRDAGGVEERHIFKHDVRGTDGAQHPDAQRPSSTEQSVGT